MKSLEIWNKRYEEEPGLGSGTGSKGFLLSFKVNLLNKFVEENEVSLKIVQRDCLPGTSAKFFIFQKVNDSKQERS